MNSWKKFANLSFKVGRVESDTEFKLELALAHGYLEQGNFLLTFQPDELLGVFLVLEAEPAFFVIELQEFAHLAKHLVDLGVIVGDELALLFQRGYSYSDLDLFLFIFLGRGHFHLDGHIQGGGAFSPYDV